MRTTAVSVLAILPRSEDQACLSQIFSHSKWNLRLVDGLAPARPLIDELAAGVVITDHRLPDGHWRDVLLDLQCREIEPVLIVASRLADDGLWAEVLNLGGYDVLGTPFQAAEVVRAVSIAWRHWQDRALNRDRILSDAMAAGARALSATF